MIYLQYLAEREKASKFERHLAFEKKTCADLNEKLQRLESEHKDLTTEYINLKSNYTNITQEYQKQVGNSKKHL